MRDVVQAAGSGARGCVTLDKLLDCLEPQFTHLGSGVRLSVRPSWSEKLRAALESPRGLKHKRKRCPCVHAHAMRSQLQAGP